jgi:hypothetical protein
MLTIIFLGMLVALLGIGFVFALMAKSNKRRGQAEIPEGEAEKPRQERAPGLD